MLTIASMFTIIRRAAPYIQWAALIAACWQQTTLRNQTSTAQRTPVTVAIFDSGAPVYDFQPNSALSTRGCSANTTFCCALSRFWCDQSHIYDCPGGHGTSVTGIVRALAPASAIVPVKVSLCTGAVVHGAVDNGTKWLVGAAALKPPVVVSLPFSHRDTRRVPVLGRAVRRLLNANFTVVQPSGNNGEHYCQSPHSANNLVVVGGLMRVGDGSWVVWPGSNWGACVDVYAPSENVETVDPVGMRVRKVTGTSMGAAVVTGMLAECMQFRGVDECVHLITAGVRIFSGGVVPNVFIQDGVRLCVTHRSSNTSSSADRGNRSKPAS